MDQMPMMSDQEGQGTPLDSIIAQVQGYMQNPASVTPETLASLLSDLTDLKSVVDGEEQDDPPMRQSPAPTKGGLSEMMGGNQ